MQQLVHDFASWVDQTFLENTIRDLVSPQLAKQLPQLLVSKKLFLAFLSDPAESKGNCLTDNLWKLATVPDPKKTSQHRCSAVSRMHACVEPWCMANTKDRNEDRVLNSSLFITEQHMCNLDELLKNLFRPRIDHFHEGPGRKEGLNDIKHGMLKSGRIADKDLDSNGVMSEMAKFVQKNAPSNGNPRKVRSRLTEKCWNFRRSCCSTLR